MGYVIYQGRLDELEGKPPFGDGECVALPQGVTNVGHTSTWRPGPRVVDLSYLNPGTVIANFIFDAKGIGRFPNKHGYHAALFDEFGPWLMAAGVPLLFYVYDQFRNRKPADIVKRRPIHAYPSDDARKRGIMPADNASEFHVVMV